MATLLTYKGESREVLPKHDTFNLEELYSILNCNMVQLIILPDGRGMWVDEYGKAKLVRREQVNALATKLLVLADGIDGDYVVGDVLLTNLEEISSGEYF